MSKTSDLEMRPGKAWENTLRGDKMAAEKQKDSMAIELLNVITGKKFTKVLCVLDESKAVNLDQFKASHATLMQKHWIDTSQLLTANKQPKCDGIYEIFGRYSGQSPNESDGLDELMTNMSITL